MTQDHRAALGLSGRVLLPLGLVLLGACGGDTADADAPDATPDAQLDAQIDTNHDAGSVERSEEDSAVHDAGAEMDGSTAPVDQDAQIADADGPVEDAAAAHVVDAQLTDGAVGDAAPDAQNMLPVPDSAASKFLAYGQLRLAFDRPVDASTLSVAIAPTRPSQLAVVGVSQSGPNGLLVTLNAYHLPLDYKATVTGPSFKAEFELQGAGNGSRTAFLSSHTGKGDLRTWTSEAGAASQGREAGDIICQNEADAAGLKGTFRAFLSSKKQDDTYDAPCRALGLTGQWDQKCGQAAQPSDSAPLIDQSGVPLVEGASGMAAQQWLMPVRQLADGQRADEESAWTGSLANGRAEGSDCSGFTSASASFIGTASARPSASLLSDDYRLKCDAYSLHIVCVQSGTGFFPLSTLHQRTGKAVFVTPTSFPWPTSNVLAQADGFCQSAASAASLPNSNNFMAWLTDNDQHAPCRLVANGGSMGSNKCGLGIWPSAGPWVRRDGFLVAENVTELLSGELSAPLLKTSTGTFVADNVWTITNTRGDGTPSGACSGGVATSTTWWSSFYSPQSCSGLMRPLVCFER
jgi:hypothetical protein